ncbi:MAG: threonylcarbamoyl-AMP synthase [Planctomycetota bacterium]|nr:MAG: threonylcarbamoyl-AMP synthase [Planctomycetota bacterium]
METEVIALTGEKFDIEKVKAAAGKLDEGKLVAFGTETVYGIGCRVRTDSINRLDEVKGRGGGKRYTLHIADPELVAGYVPTIPLKGRKLIAKGWPGPLTIVFELDEGAVEKQRDLITNDAFEVLYRDNTIGIRCPDNEIARRLLRCATEPVVAPSANLDGRAPATSADGVLAQLDGRIDIILDGGECKYKKSSTVVKIAQAQPIILRQGVYSEKDIAQMSLIRILFVCAGNTCRSPMAAALCKKKLCEKLNCTVDEIEARGYKIASAGLMGGAGIPASKEVVSICAREGIDLSKHRSRALASSEAEASDYIFAMTKSHREQILEICPAVAEKCLLLDGNGEISDPIGAGVDVYEKCAQHIERALVERIGGILV